MRVTTPTAATARFLDSLWTRSPIYPERTFDPWNQACPDDVDGDGIARRRAALASHFACRAPRLLLVAEAPGYQGARLSGVAMTSEALIWQGAVPRVGSYGLRLSTRAALWREPTATIVWRALYEHGLAEHTLLWNLFPWHPHPAGAPLRNRAPDRDEQALGLEVLRDLIAALPQRVTVAAVGRIAQAGLATAGVDSPALRHPSNGGAPAFRSQLADLAQSQQMEKVRR